MTDGSMIFIRNVPLSFQEADLHREIGLFGDIQHLTILRHCSTRASLGCAIITFKYEASVAICREVLAQSKPVLDVVSKLPLQTFSPLREPQPPSKKCPVSTVRVAVIVHGLSFPAFKSPSPGELVEKLVDLFATFDEHAVVELLPPSSARVQLTSMIRARRALQTINWCGVRVFPGGPVLEVVLDAGVAAPSASRGL